LCTEIPFEEISPGNSWAMIKEISAAVKTAALKPLVLLKFPK
jgi:hypothetical protein